MSKGSRPRPKSVDADTFDARWGRTFGQPCPRCGKWLPPPPADLHTCSPTREADHGE
jgi:uncharacterized OB-fold protein